MRNIVLTLSAVGLLVTASPTIAAPCRNAAGKFVKCPPKPAAPARCKDAKGKFAMCGRPGAKPA